MRPCHSIQVTIQERYITMPLCLLNHQSLRIKMMMTECCWSFSHYILYNYWQHSQIQSQLLLPRSLAAFQVLTSMIIITMLDWHDYLHLLIGMHFSQTTVYSLLLWHSLPPFCTRYNSSISLRTRNPHSALNTLPTWGLSHAVPGRQRCCLIGHSPWWKRLHFILA